MFTAGVYSGVFLVGVADCILYDILVPPFLASARVSGAVVNYGLDLPHTEFLVCVPPLCAFPLPMFGETIILCIALRRL